MRRIKSPDREAFDDGWDKALATLERLVNNMSIPTETYEEFMGANDMVTKVIDLIERLRK